MKIRKECIFEKCRAIGNFLINVNRAIFIATIVLLCGNCLICRAQQTHIRRYTIEDGLVNNDVLTIYQDSRGFIWLCTRGGLSRYDGSRFTNFTTANGLNDDMINDIYEAAPGEFIVAQNSGGPRLIKNEQLGPFEPGNKITVNRFYPLGYRKFLAAVDARGLVEWSNDRLKIIDPANTNSFSQLVRLNDSFQLALEINRGVQLLSNSFQPRSPLMAHEATTLFTDSKGRAWMGTVRGLKLVDPKARPGKSLAFLALPASYDLPILQQAYICDIIEDSRGSTWIGTVNGLVSIDKNGHSVIYAEKDGLPSSFVNCIKEDRQNNIWVGTPLGLAKLLLNSEVNRYTFDFGFSHAGVFGVSPVSKEEFRIFNGTRMMDFNPVTGKLSNIILVDSPGYRLLTMGPHEILLGKNKKGFLYRNGRKEVESIKWPDMTFTTLARTVANDYLLGYSDGIWLLNDGHSIEKIRTGIPSPIYCVTIDKKNTLWAGTWDGGLVKIKIERDRDSLQLKLVDTLAGRLPDRQIRTLYSDRENELWIGTRNRGLVRLLELPGAKYEIQHYGTGQGLCSDFVHTINRDPHGNIWAGTAQGIDKLIADGNLYRVFNFGKVNQVFSKISDIDFPDSNYLVASGILSMIHAKDIQQDTLPPPPVYITKISGGPADSSRVSFADAVRLPFDKAQIYFEFSAPQFINEDFTQFSYRLLGGNDTAWNTAGKSRSVYFANLRPGKYTFQVRALGFNGKWGSASVYGFVVNAPYWQQAWFLVLMALAIGLLAYGLYRYRVHQLIRLQRMRNRIATDLHDEIGSNLTNISILSNLSKKNIMQPARAGDFLQRISEEVSSSSQALDDIIWSVDANHDTLEETVARMRRYAAELFDSANISYELYLDPVFEGKRLSMEQRRDLYLLYKEAVNNISKHAQAKHVSIQIAVQQNQLLLFVKDDGRGFDTSLESSRHGLKGMKLRVSKWKGRINVESGPGQGTAIQIRLPVSK